jgi:hypothetical protein
MADPSSDERFVELVARALRDCRLEAVVVGATAAVLQGAPLTTVDVDLLVRRTPSNEKKIQRLCERLELARVPVTSTIESLAGESGQVDILYDTIPPRLTFESVRSRASRMRVGGAALFVASLEDILRSKRAAGRPKDLAALPTLEDTLRVRRALEKTSRKKRSR